MKTDSDMFVNIYYLTELLLKKNRTTRFFTGFLKLNEYPIRKRFNKWFVSKYEYPWDKYPPFCSGTGYVFSSDVAGEVYHVANSVPFIKLEDVFVGLCLKRLEIRLEELHSEQTFFPDGLPFTTCRYKKIVASHHIKPRDILSSCGTADLQVTIHPCFLQTANSAHLRLKTEVGGSFPGSYPQYKIHTFALSSMTGLECDEDQPETQKEP
ncbi:hypothetical protein MJG53_000663 [Ovis ammon polii x Ovis aries]|uniref:Uncharacterized protein n=1 Tax=Ovis ammon polii x Ovis aries TaxID=2918886 RepID=A0ACB9VJ99_9CETA|nr:hypothetical protein MJG53_000663 [Ovis ammon polii x Ovis aries]